ncbi:MAG: hypothetical protein NVSMB47_21200 [Polyangiales bacterium]
MVPPAGKTPTTSPTTPPTPMPTGSTPPPPVSAPPSKLPLILTGLSDAPHEVLRSKSLAVKGRVLASDGAACTKLRIEVVLRQAGTGLERIAGQLLTDDGGYYDGTVGVPSDLPLGDYSVTGHTPGAGGCGPGSSE